MFIGQLLWVFSLRSHRSLNHDALLIIGQAALGLLIVSILLLLRTTPANAIRLSRKQSELMILFGAIVLQMAALGWLVPTLSTDVVRYRTDGRMWLAGVSPYANSPDEWRLAGGELDVIDSTNSHPEFRSIYPPMSQGIFLLVQWVEQRIIPESPRREFSEQARTNWREIVPDLPWFHRGFGFRLTFAGISIAVTWVLFKRLRETSDSPWLAVLFAWNPLLILETGGMGHQDIAGALLLLMMVGFCRARRFGLAGVMLALACGIKPPVVVLFPFLARDAQTQSRAAKKTIVSFLFISLLLFLPLALSSRGLLGWLRTGSMFSVHWEFNGSIYELGKWILIQPGDLNSELYGKIIIRAVTILLMLVTLVMLWKKKASAEMAAYIALTFALLMSAVVYPWYLIWPMVFVPLLRGRFGWTILIWSATVGISYVAWHEPMWHVPGRLATIQYLPVYVSLMIEMIAFARSKQRDAELNHGVASVSV